MLLDSRKFTGYLATLRFTLFISKTGETPVTEFWRGRMTAALKIADSHLAKREFVVAPNVMIADFSLAKYLFYDDELPFDMQDYPNLANWKQRMTSLPVWKAPYDLMPRAKAPF
jgi:glutathione S-transferase